MNFKKSFSLLELIIALFVGSIIVVYSFSFSSKLFKSQITNEELAVLKLDLNSTKIFIEKNLPQSKDLLKYENKTLFFNNHVLLKDVSSFNISNISNTLSIEITLDEKISQTWKFKL